MATRHESLKRYALGLPDAYEDMPWEGDVVAKAGKKIFVFFGSPDGGAISVKLPESQDHALSIRGAQPTSYGLGRHGWVTVPITGAGAPAVDLLRDWIEESYRAVAPKRLVARLREDTQ
jgi:predicted DNA-binding protein (MmcQ/YjbR family)